MGVYHKKLIDGETAGTSVTSEWIPAAQLNNLSIHLTGLAAGDTVDIEGSNEPSPTAGNAVQLGQVSDGDDLVAVDDGPNWVRLNVTAAGGGGTLNCWATAFRRES